MAAHVNKEVTRGGSKSKRAMRKSHGACEGVQQTPVELDSDDNASDGSDSSLDRRIDRKLTRRLDSLFARHEAKLERMWQEHKSSLISRVNIEVEEAFDEVEERIEEIAESVGRYNKKLKARVRKARKAEKSILDTYSSLCYVAIPVIITFHKFCVLLILI